MPPKRGERGRMRRLEMNEWYRKRDDGMAVRVLMLGESLQSVADDFGIRAGSVGAILKSAWKDYYDLACGNVNLSMMDWEWVRHPLREVSSTWRWQRGLSPLGPITDLELEEVFRDWPPEQVVFAPVVVDMGEVQ